MTVGDQTIPDRASRARRGQNRPGAEIREVGGDLVATATATFQTVSLDAARARMSLEGPEGDRLRAALSTLTFDTPVEAPHVRVD
jgi:hypothetical protein